MKGDLPYQMLNDYMAAAIKIIRILAQEQTGQTEQSTETDEVFFP